jgi:hypothetical protein
MESSEEKVPQILPGKKDAAMATEAQVPLRQFHNLT